MLKDRPGDEHGKTGIAARLLNSRDARSVALSMPQPALTEGAVLVAVSGQLSKVRNSDAYP
jgi:hypothetical protein